MNIIIYISFRYIIILSLEAYEIGSFFTSSPVDTPMGAIRQYMLILKGLLYTLPLFFNRLEAL